MKTDPLRAATGQCHQVPLYSRRWRFDSAAAHHIIKYTDMTIILFSLLLAVIAVGGGYAIGEWLAKDMIKFIKNLIS